MSKDLNYTKIPFWLKFLSFLSKKHEMNEGYDL